VTNILDTAIPKLKQHLVETGKAYSVKDISEYLELKDSTTIGVLDIMGAFGIVEKRKNGVYYYYLKDTYSEEQIKAMLLDTPHGQMIKLKPIKTKRRARPIKTKTKSKSFLENYLSDLEKRANSGNGLAALAILGLPQKSVEPITMEPTREKEPELRRELVTLKAMGTVKDLPKNIRRLPKNETNYLKKLLKHLGGYQIMNGLDTGYAKFSAIKAGRYGDEYYFSKGTNSWDNILNITVDPSLSNSFLLPTKENQRWSQWNKFQNGLLPKKPSRARNGLYDEIIEKFIESGHKLVEITVEDLGANYVRAVLRDKIKKRNLLDQIEVSRVDDWIYLEKVD